MNRSKYIFIFCVYSITAVVEMTFNIQIYYNLIEIKIWYDKVLDNANGRQWTVVFVNINTVTTNR